jgi:hypothetical protein
MKRISGTVAALSLGLSIFGSVVRAQEASPAPAVAIVPEDQRATKEQLAQLIEVMRVKQQMSSMTRSMPAIMQQQFQQQMDQMKKDYPQMASLTADQQQAMNNIMRSFMEQAMSLYSSDEVIADVTALYQKHLAQPDVEATIVFYTSPAGQHVLDMVPAVMQELLPTVMQKMQERMRPMILEMTKQMAEIATSGADKSSQK